MKIITLNIWGGCLSTELFEFFKKYSDVDVFLLQEVFHNATDVSAWEKTDRREAFKEIGDILNNHQGYFAPTAFEEWGLASFVKNTIEVEESGDIFVHGHKNSLVGKDGSTLGRNLQYLKLSNADKKITVANFHGLWNGKGKTDTEDRIAQSERIVDFIKNIPDDIVLGGDFNLKPDTESIKIIEKKLNLKNLVLEHGILSTRTSHYTKSEKFADYIFTSPNIIVKEFKVLPEEVSDHAALFLEITPND